MKKKLIFVIGAGSAGVRFARKINKHDFDVYLAESKDLGGTCVNQGCIPKKLFAYASEFDQLIHDSTVFGWDSANLGAFNWQNLRNNVQNEIKRLNKIYSKLLENSGVKVLHNSAKFISNDTISCGSQNFIFDIAVVACGSKPSIPPIIGIEHCITSNEIFKMATFPKTAVILGGGYIALELASILIGLGCGTTLINRSKYFLRGFEPELTKEVLFGLRKRGLNILEDVTVDNIKDNNGSKLIATTNGSYSADIVVAALGRVPKTENLGLENAITNYKEGLKITVNDGFKTSNDKIYALGDVIEQSQLTPVAIAHAERLISILEKKNIITALADEHIPSAVFTNPEFASVGVTEEKACRIYGTKNVIIFESKFSSLHQIMQSDPNKTSIKLICKNDMQKTILGVHMVGHGVAEIIQMFTPFVKFSNSKDMLDSVIGIHPSVGEEFFSMQNSRPAKS